MLQAMKEVLPEDKFKNIKLLQEYYVPDDNELETFYNTLSEIDKKKVLNKYYEIKNKQNKIAPSAQPLPLGGKSRRRKRKTNKKKTRKAKKKTNKKKRKGNKKRKTRSRTRRKQ